MDFYKRIELACNKIPFGSVATYGQIALLCGKPRNSRQVGFGLNRKVEGKDVPAYRVVNHKGFLTGRGSFETQQMQQVLLESEGVEVSENNQVDLRRFGWKNTLEDALELRVLYEKEHI